MHSTKSSHRAEPCLRHSIWRRSHDGRHAVSVQDTLGSASEFQLNLIVIAHDGSSAASRALEDAIALSSRYHSQILVARVEPPVEEFSGGAHPSRADDTAELETIKKRFLAERINVRTTIRTGLVGDTLFDIVRRERADLLMLGAYGHGTQDRQTLGSTAEHLLRSVQCPTLTYGPQAKSGLHRRLNTQDPILLPISLPCNIAQLEKVVRIVRLFSDGIDIIHVASHSHSIRIQSEDEKACENLAAQLRTEGLRISWSLFFGVPESMIYASSIRSNTPFILFPLKRRDRLSSIFSDNLAAQVIRRATVPVMTFRID